MGLRKGQLLHLPKVERDKPLPAGLLERWLRSKRRLKRPPRPTVESQWETFLKNRKEGESYVLPNHMSCTHDHHCRRLKILVIKQRQDRQFAARVWIYKTPYGGGNA